MALLYPALRRRRRTWNDYVTLSNLSDDEVFQLTRFPRHTVEELVQLLGDDLERQTRRSHAIPPETQVVAALQFYSSGSFQWVLGHSMNLSQSSVSRVIDGVTDSLCKLAGKTITFPVSQNKLAANKQAFHSIAGFPNVIGAIDCTHVPIKSPSINEDAFVNRKGIHTINVQAVCDAEMKILDVVAKWPGSAHDSFIWRSSSLHDMFEDGHLQSGWLLGM